MFRRVLLGASTALLTARMLAPGEDPGLLQNTSGPTNLLLPAFLAAGRRRSGRLAGVVAPGRLARRLGRGGPARRRRPGLCRAESAVYKHPARLIAWEWLTFFILVCLVRQLAVSPGDQQALFAVFLAGAAALSAAGRLPGAFLHVPRRRPSPSRAPSPLGWRCSCRASHRRGRLSFRPGAPLAAGGLRASHMPVAAASWRPFSPPIGRRTRRSALAGNLARDRKDDRRSPCSASAPATSRGPSHSSRGRTPAPP